MTERRGSMHRDALIRQMLALELEEPGARRRKDAEGMKLSAQRARMEAGMLASETEVNILSTAETLNSAREFMQTLYPNYIPERLAKAMAKLDGMLVGRGRRSRRSSHVWHPVYDASGRIRGKIEVVPGRVGDRIGLVRIGQKTLYNAGDGPGGGGDSPGINFRWSRKSGRNKKDRPLLAGVKKLRA